MGVFLGVIASGVGMLMLCGLSCLISRLWHPYLWVGTARPTTDQVILARAKTVVRQVDWYLVQTMEMDLEGMIFHDLQGNLLAKPRTRADLEAERSSPAAPAEIRNMTMDEYATFLSAQRAARYLQPDGNHRRSRTRSGLHA